MQIRLFCFAHPRWHKIVPTVPTFLSTPTKRKENQQNNGWNGPSNFSNFVQLNARLVGTQNPGILELLPSIDVACLRFMPLPGMDFKKFKNCTIPRFWIFTRLLIETS
jgi:hypothetical protein